MDLLRHLYPEIQIRTNQKVISFEMQVQRLGCTLIQ